MKIISEVAKNNFLLFLWNEIKRFKLEVIMDVYHSTTSTIRISTKHPLVLNIPVIVQAHIAITYFVSSICSYNHTKEVYKLLNF